MEPDSDEVRIYCGTRAAVRKARDNPLCRRLPCGDFVCKKCPVCLEALSKNVETLPCGHTFHKACVVACENQTKNLKCPMCASPLCCLLLVACCLCYP